jgi:hypothetical protein
MLVAPSGGSAGFEGIGSAVSGIVEAADEGFAISENGGQPLLDAISELSSEVAHALANASSLEHQPALGSTPNATVFKPFLATIASDPAQGAIPVLRKLQQDLTAAHQAIQKSMDNYSDSDQGNAANIGSAGNG